jgi:hypothetical protein
MQINDTKELPVGIKMQCYVCNDLPATHVRRYKIDDLMVQVCLCRQCMQIDTEDLIKNTLGIREPSSETARRYHRIASRPPWL